MGWDIERFPEGEVNLELICCICTCILEDPVESPCRHVFCSACIKTWLSNQKSCPHCRAPVYRKDLQSVVPLLKNIISKQKIYCDNRENGCEEIATIESLSSHVATCQYGIVSCANEGCIVKICRKDLKSHFEVCSKRTVLCERGCEMLLTVGERTTHNCVQALRRHFQETTNEMQSRISKLEELVNVLVSKTLANREDTARVIETPINYGAVPYSIPSPRAYDNAPPPFTVFSDLAAMTPGNMNAISADNNEFSDSVDSVESENTTTVNELGSRYTASILRDFDVSSRPLSVASQEREITPIYRNLSRLSDNYISRGRNERIRENVRNTDRSRSAHDRRQLDSTYLSSRVSDNRTRSRMEATFYDEGARMASRAAAEDSEEPLILRIGVSSQAMTDTSSSSGSSTDSDNG